MKSDLVDLSLRVLGETAKAVRVINLRDASVWLPKSQIEVVRDSRRPEVATVTVTLPEWLAKERELI